MSAAMLERKGRDQGRADGRADAALNLVKRPRPDLALAVMFAGYGDAYLKTYGAAYGAQRRVEEQQKSNQLVRKVPKPQMAKSTPRDRIFERGWKDGYDGKEKPTWRLSENDKAIYQRGYMIGQRHRDYERAEQLRQSTRHQNLHRTQGKSR